MVLSLLTTDEGLKELDAYLIQYIRYLYSGRHYKGNYRVTYEKIKELGFRSLVNEFYKRAEVILRDHDRVPGLVYKARKNR